MAWQQADDAGVQVGAVIAVWRAGPLARVEPVWPGQDAEHQGRVPHGPGDGAKVIEGYLDRERAGVRDQAVRRLVPDHAAERRRDPDRTALVAAERQVCVTGRDQGGAAAG